MPNWPKDLAALAFVHSGLIAATAGAAWFVHTQSPTLPLSDEWDVLHGWVESDSTWSWALAHHNEHRYPLSKLLWLGILRATGFNFAAPQYATLGLLIASALLFLWIARSLRGRAHPVDLMFPALLLHFGHAFNLQMGYQVGFALVAYAIAGWLWCAAKLSNGGGPAWALLSGGYAGALILCGGFGLAFTPVVLFWFGYLGLRAKREGRRHSALAFGAFFALALGYSAWTALTMPKFQVSGGLSPLEQPGDFLTGVAGYLTSAAGCWPGRDPMESWVVVAVAIPILLAYGVGFRMLANVIDDSDSRRRTMAVAILLVLLGTVLVGAAAARARGVGLAERMTTSSAAGFAAVLLGMFALSSPRRGGWASIFSGVAGVSVAIGLVWANQKTGLDRAFEMRDSDHHLCADIRVGETPDFLAGRHGGGIGVLMGDRFAEQIRSFRKAGIPPFATLPDDPPYRRVAVVSKGFPASWTFAEADWLAGSPPPSLTLPDPPTGAIGLRLYVATIRSTGRMKLLLRYRSGGREQDTDAQPFYFCLSMHLFFRLEGPAKDLRLLPGSALGKIDIESAEWLVVD